MPSVFAADNSISNVATKLMPIKPHHRSTNLPSMPPSIRRIGDGAILENRYLRCNLSFAKGPLITSLVNKYIGSNVVDGQSRIFAVLHENKHISNDSFRLLKSTVNVIGKPGSIKCVCVLTTTWQCTTLPLTLTSTIKLDDSPEMKWGVKIQNTEPRMAQIQTATYVVASPLLEHVRVGDKVSDDLYFYPLETGVCGSLDYELRAYYGATLAMQVMDVFDPVVGGGVYTMVKDDSGMPKIMIIHRKSQADVAIPTYASYDDKDGQFFDAAPGSAMAVRHLEYQLKQGESATLPEALVGVHAGDWHYPLRTYSRWMHTWYTKALPTPKWYMDTYAWLGAHPFGHLYLLGKSPDPNGFWDPVKNEYAYAKQMGLAEENSVMEFATWHDYHTKKPNMPLNDIFKEYNGDVIAAGNVGDYDYNTERGGLPAFREEIRRVHENKGRLMLYTYPMACAATSRLGKEHGKEWAAMKSPGKYYYDFTSEGNGWNLCMYTPEFREYFSRLMATKVKETGSDGYRHDVLSFMYPCVNPAHAHYKGTERSSFDPAAYNQYFKSCQSAVRAVNPEGITTTEHAGSDYLTQNTDGFLIQNPIWVQEDFFKPFKVLDQYGIVFTRFYLPESKGVIHGIPRDADSVNLGIFNATAIAYMYPPKALEFDSLRENGDALNSGLTPEPMIDTLVDHVFCNYFPGVRKNVWTIYNKSGKHLNEPLIQVPYKSGVHYIEVLNDMPVKATRNGKMVTLSAPVNDQDVVCIVEMPQTMKVIVNGETAVVQSSAGDTLQVAYGEDSPGKRETVNLKNGKAIVKIAANAKTTIKLMKGYYLKDQIILDAKPGID